MCAKLKLSLLASVMSCLASGAMAYTSASASIGDMTFTLIDLDPSDGIAPSFRFLSSPDQNASIDLFTTLYSQGEEVAAIQTWTPASEGVERAFNLTANTPTQDFRSALSIRDSGISASADAWGHATTFGFVANSLLSPSAGMGLELSAKTLLHITANAQAKVAVGNSQCGPAFLVDDEAGVVMLLYLKQAWMARIDQNQTGEADLLDAIREGAVLRVRPKAMTVAVILAGLLPIMWGGGTGSEVMQRIAAPMVGGMITAPLLSMFVIPAAYYLMRRPRRQSHAQAQAHPIHSNGERP